MFSHQQTRTLFVNALASFFIFLCIGIALAEDSLKITSITPESPGSLAGGEKLQVTFQYTLESTEAAQIWVRPQTNGRATPGYGAHGSGLHKKGEGEGIGWFTFQNDAKVDSISIYMRGVGGEVLAEIQKPVDFTWAKKQSLSTSTADSQREVESGASTPVKDIVISLKDLKDKGTSGFPQQKAKILCDENDLRLSVWSNNNYLIAQAILWNDDDSSLGETADGRPIGDWSSLMLDLDGDLKRTKQVDRNYSLNPWPYFPGLRYSVVVSDRGWTGLLGDSEGRGSIQYAKTGEGKRVRIDTYAIPLNEIGKKLGDTVHIAYWGKSQKPELLVNSVEYQSEQQKYYSYHIPRDLYDDFVLINGGEFDLALVPKGRDQPLDSAGITKNALSLPTAPQLTIGSKAPSIDIENWFHEKSPIETFEAGTVYVVEFWATWCGPCVASMPHLRDLQNRYGNAIRIISVSNETPNVIEKFLDRESNGTTFRDLTSAYWLTCDPDKSVYQDYMQAADQHGIPTAFLVGKDGVIEWFGHPMQIDGPIGELLEGTWDRIAFAQEKKQLQKLESGVRQARRLASLKKFDESVALLDKLTAETKTQRLLASLAAVRKSIMAEKKSHVALTANSRDTTAFEGIWLHEEEGLLKGDRKKLALLINRRGDGTLNAQFTKQHFSSQPSLFAIEYSQGTLEVTFRLFNYYTGRRASDHYITYRLSMKEDVLQGTYHPSWKQAQAVTLKRASPTDDYRND